MPSARTPLLGGRTPAAFMRTFWHKQALAVSGALPGFSGFLSLADLQALAARDDVESRLVVREGRRWSLAHGPFKRRDFAGLPARNWTLLVQGVNLHDDRGDALLRRFAFVPFARLDDLMVSYAAPGGGVGPHFDSYDVFLVQGEGRRRWRYGAQDDLSLRPGLPVKILARFAPSHEAVFGPGDLLYLPPHVAHDGDALEPCTTYSIGFRAASAQELATAFLDHLRDHVELDGRYRDPDLAPTRAPGRVDPRMTARVETMLAKVKWNRGDVARFLGCWLSEPKPIVVFRPPAPALALAAFARAIAGRGVELDRCSQMLYDERSVYVNGEATARPAEGGASLAALADARRLGARDCAALARPAIALLHGWYRDGYLRPSA
jgi:50S ribosomal protein L16 3-hydroxylase